MKNLFALMAVVLIVSIVMVACSDNKRDIAQTALKNTNCIQDTAKSQLNGKDSTIHALELKVDTLTQRINSITENLSTLEQRVKNLESPSRAWNLPTLLALALGVIATSLFLWMSKGVVDKKMLEEFKGQIKSLMKGDKDREPKAESDSPTPIQQTFPSKNGQDEYNELEERIRNLESNLAQIRQSLESSNVGASTKEYLSNNIEYAQNNSSTFFMTLSSSLQENSVYKITPTSPDKGEFEILSIEKIRQRNGWEEAVEYSGNCNIHEAVGFKVDKKGHCVRTDSGRWKITSKLIITIYK